jgi:hypothetical protein
MTHRVFSRNAASSRAIPVEKLIKDVEENPFIPVYWGKNQKGMQAGEEIDAPVQLWSDISLGLEDTSNKEAWLEARNQAVQFAYAFSRAGYHKQIVNRLLEPFAHITVLVSSTEWTNFLELRGHPDAEPHIQLLAKEIRKCLEDQTLTQALNPGEWHLPFIGGLTPFPTSPTLHELIKLSVARCASTSYKTVDGFDMSLERAQEITDKLLAANPIHASPAEHVACADGLGEDSSPWKHPWQHGNFVGFRQYRHML